MIRMQFVLDTVDVEAGFRQCIEEEKKMILILETKLESKIQYMDDFYEKKPDELSCWRSYRFCYKILFIKIWANQCYVTFKKVCQKEEPSLFLGISLLYSYKLNQYSHFVYSLHWTFS